MALPGSADGECSSAKPAQSRLASVPCRRIHTAYSWTQHLEGNTHSSVNMAEEDEEGGFNMDSDGKYHLQIISASDLMKKDLFGASDPYVRVFAVYHSPNGETRKTEVAKTRTIKNNLNPDWSEGFTVTINTDLDYILDFFLLEVWDENRLIRDDFLGQVEILCKIYHIIYHISGGD